MDLPSDYLDQLRREYPKRWGDQGWIAVRTLVPRAITGGATWVEIFAGTLAYRSYCEARGIVGSEYVKQARTFYGPQQMWTEDYGVPEKPKTAQQLRDEAAWDRLKQRAAAIGFRGPRPVDSIGTYETSVREAERLVQPPSIVAELASRKRL